MELKYIKGNTIEDQLTSIDKLLAAMYKKKDENPTISIKAPKAIQGFCTIKDIPVYTLGAVLPDGIRINNFYFFVEPLPEGVTISAELFLIDESGTTHSIIFRAKKGSTYEYPHNVELPKNSRTFAKVTVEQGTLTEEVKVWLAMLE